ncbi:zeta toxin family protein [Cytophagaceae bacterium YF14B1]|uniref:Zeta toxin family protein n=1 Tax=Xanthocytophaga flava TaxID=3048013 RepID=A0AAE3U6H6_9BACT|nr:zeta toxin family protein [Xanthocytophaga flavus]MDJ1480587.1 zeta toxin family protein [Xanthocytophaga flavus]
MDKPQLYIIAGPNGAGKSVLSKWLVNKNIDVFDGDLLQKELSLKYKAIPWEQVQHLAAREFEKRWSNALEKREDFAYETNFTFPNSIDLPLTFQKHGYEINMFYLGIGSIAESIRRVALRVEKGGHDVDTGSIELNFTGGITHVHQHFDKFDRFLFIDNSIISTPRIVLYAELGKIKSKSPTLPRWMTTYFARLLSIEKTVLE